MASLKTTRSWPEEWWSEGANVDLIFILRHTYLLADERPSTARRKSSYMTP